MEWTKITQKYIIQKEKLCLQRDSLNIKDQQLPKKQALGISNLSHSPTSLPGDFFTSFLNVGVLPTSRSLLSRPSILSSQTVPYLQILLIMINISKLEPSLKSYVLFKPNFHLHLPAY